MKRNQVLALLVAALVVAGVGWKLAAKEPRQEVAPLSWFDEPGFIVVEGDGPATVTVQNPRAADGWVFYVTAVLGKGCSGASGVYYPPELQHQAGTTETAWFPASTNYVAGMLLPVVTTIDVRFTGPGGCIVLSGYYSLQQPNITSVVFP